MGSDTDEPDSGAKVDAAPAEESVGDWPCYPEPGDYMVHFTRTAGDPKNCPDIPDSKVSVTDLEGAYPDSPGCTSTTNKAACSVTTVCKRVSARATVDESTVITFARGQVPPVKGTRHSSTHRNVDAGAGDGGMDAGVTDFECTYEYVYRK